MAPDPCTPCECIPGNIPNSTFKQMVIEAICEVVAAIQGGGGLGENVNVAAWGGVATTLGQKLKAASVPVTLASDQGTLTVAGSGNFTVVQPTGTNLHAVLDATSTTTVTQATGTNLHTVVDSGVVTPTPGTTGGWTPVFYGTLNATKQAPKVSAGTFGGYIVNNTDTSTNWAYIQVFDLASGSVTVGTTPPKYVIMIPPGSTANVEFACGIHHGTAITIAATTTPTGNTNPVSTVNATILFA